MAASKSVCQSSRFVTSPATAIARPCFTSGDDASAISLATRSAAGPFRSLTTTFAPSRANVFAMPSPKPEPPPVTITVFPCSRMASPLSVLDRDGLERREAVQRLEAFLAPVSRMLHAAERQFDAAARAVIVDEHLTRA